MKKTWGGRFSKSTDPQVEAFTESISFDYRLAPFDIEVSLAHVQALAKAKLISSAEKKKLTNGLKKIKKLWEDGKLSLTSNQEDIHTAIEQALTSIVGPLGGKLHTGRSRNDQVATDFRLYLHWAIKSTVQAGIELIESLANLSLQEKNTLVPGFTHLQRAMPVTLGHHLAAYGFMLVRDMDRFLTTWDRANAMPLGSGALAGTNHPLDRRLTANLLKFKAILQNSMDAVSDRDVFIDYLSAAAITQMHLSRLSEDIILWATVEFGFVELDDAFATGSSLMPQKKNPDVAELVRGKTARTIANLTGLLTVLKGLPLSYNRDLQEDKHFVFDSVDTVVASLKIMKGLISTLKFKRDRMYQSANEDLTLLATDLADILVKNGMPFRMAHEVVGKVVQNCIKRGKRIQDLTDQELQAFSKIFPLGTSGQLSIQNSVNHKKALGGTSPENVSSQALMLKNEIIKISKRANL